MKLAEALSRRSELQKFIARSEGQLDAITRVQEGETLEILPEEIIPDIERSLKELERLTANINKTNTSVVLKNGKTMTEMMAIRDRLNRLVSMYHSLTSSLFRRDYRLTRGEIKYVNTMSVKEVRQTYDQYAKQLRDVNFMIQEANWQFDLCE